MTSTPAAAASADPARSAVADSPSPSVLARRQATAQAYLDTTRAAAEARRQSALGVCEQATTPDRNACISSAEDAFEAEMRAARVEFDAQMTRPE